MNPMTADDLDAAWAAVHDATPPGWFVRRGRVALAVLALVVMGCLPRQQQPPPAEFIDRMASEGYSFTVAAPPAGVLEASQVLPRLGQDFLPEEAAGQPIFGVLACVDESRACGDGGIVQPGRPRGFWLVPYPGTPGDEGDAWALVDAFTNVMVWNNPPQ